VPAEKQSSESSPSPFPGRAILLALQAPSSTRLRATRNLHFPAPPQNQGLNAHPKRRKQTLRLLFRTNSCSNRRLFALVEPTGLFLVPQGFISTLAALGGGGSSRTSGMKSPVQRVEQACLCTCQAVDGKLTGEHGHRGCGRGMTTRHKARALDLPVPLSKTTAAR